VSLGVMILRKKDPGRPRPFRTPALFVVAPLSIAGCLLLFINLNNESKLLFVSWTAIGLVLYFLYGYRHSHLAHGVIEVPEVEAEAPGSIGVAPMPHAPAPPQDRDD
jgi:basic amino acid/polyamine antiporter, APA family